MKETSSKLCQYSQNLYSVYYKFPVVAISGRVFPKQYNELRVTIRFSTSVFQEFDQAILLDFKGCVWNCTWRVTLILRRFPVVALLRQAK